MKILFYLLLFFTFLVGKTNFVLAQYTPESIYTAARSGNLNIVTTFLEKGIDQQTLNSALGAAIAGEQLDVMDILIRHGADVSHISSFNTSLLNNAIMLGFYKSAAKLIEAGADPNVYGFKRKERNFLIDWSWTPLMCAAYQGQKELIESLLKKGADAKLYGWSNSPNDLESAADIAAYRGHLDILKILMKNDSPISKETVFKTVRGGHTETFKYLMKNEKNINQLGKNNKTLLMEASWWGRKDIIEWLVKKKADVNYKNSDGETALL
nr:ankyrin repeat domain-containing protein [Candidatus Omnitrophota bacterium]